MKIKLINDKESENVALVGLLYSGRSRETTDCSQKQSG